MDTQLREVGLPMSPHSAHSITTPAHRFFARQKPSSQANCFVKSSASNPEGFTSSRHFFWRGFSWGLTKGKRKRYHSGYQTSLSGSAECRSRCFPSPDQSLGLSVAAYTVIGTVVLELYCLVHYRTSVDSCRSRVDAAFKSHSIIGRMLCFADSQNIRYSSCKQHLVSDRIKMWIMSSPRSISTG